LHGFGLSVSGTAWRNQHRSIRWPFTLNLGVDSIVGKHDDWKADKIGEWLSEKNICANVLNWQMCWWTGMAVLCCSVFAVDLEKHEQLFLRPGVTVAQRR
jgi:hypothetical protein